MYKTIDNINSSLDQLSERIRVLLEQMFVMNAIRKGYKVFDRPRIFNPKIFYKGQIEKNPNFHNIEYTQIDELLRMLNSNDTQNIDLALNVLDNSNVNENYNIILEKIDSYNNNYTSKWYKELTKDRRKIFKRSY